jgi:hypothetical protein
MSAYLLDYKQGVSSKLQSSNQLTLQLVLFLNYEIVKHRKER